MPDGGPDLLVDHEVCLCRHFLGNLFSKLELVDVLFLEELYRKLLEAIVLLFNESCLNLEVVHPLCELRERDTHFLFTFLVVVHAGVALHAEQLDNISNLFVFLIVDLSHDLSHILSLPLFFFLLTEHMSVVTRINAVDFELYLLKHFSESFKVVNFVINFLLILRGGFDIQKRRPATPIAPTATAA